MSVTNSDKAPNKLSRRLILFCRKAAIELAAAKVFPYSSPNGKSKKTAPQSQDDQAHLRTNEIRPDDLYPDERANHGQEVNEPRPRIAHVFVGNLRFEKTTNLRPVKIAICVESELKNNSLLAPKLPHL